jgi:uncharacterized Zn finger protein
MNLTNFENQVSSVIFDRGCDYFENGKVGDLQQLSSGEWVAEVEGNYGDYTVEINVDNQGNIEDYSCNCPFDGPVCKHVVAVLLAIREEQKSAKSKPDAKKTPPEWESIIANAPEKELRSFLLGYAKKHRELQDELVINLSASPKKVDIHKYQKMIAHTFDAAAGRHGFIEYRDTYAAMQPVYNLLEKADEHLEKGNLHEAFSIAAAVAPECLDAIQCIDDSDGECGGAINMAFETVDKILSSCTDEPLTDAIYDWLLEQVHNHNYDDYGCADELELIFFNWANNPYRLEKAYMFIENQLEKYKKTDDWSAQYQLTKYLKYKTELLINEGKLDEADQIVEENLHLSDFRKIKIEEALNKNDCQAAILHIHEGIVQAEKDKSPGIVHQFKDQLLDIYKKQDDRGNIRKLSKELFLDNRNSINYYRTYKGTFNTSEWSGKCEEIIAAFQKQKKKNSWGYIFPSELASVYIEEKMWDRLLGEVKLSSAIGIVDGYSKYLAPCYPDELITLYRNSIVKYAENTGRNIYSEIVRYLKNMAKLQGGKDCAKELVQQLLDAYKNRPAMKDEFRKINW